MEPTILMAFAHPDDESFGLSGTILKYTQRGVAVDLICATRGEVGERLGVADDVDTGTAREAELRAAAAITGVRNIYLLGYIDGQLHTVDPGELADRVLEVMRRVRPGVIITFGPDGITGHLDHIAIGKAASRAFEELCRDDGLRRKLYYVTIPESAVRDRGELGVTTRPDAEVTTRISIGEQLDAKLRAMAAHRSQRGATEFVEMLESNRQSPLATTEHLYLALPRGATDETDLFA